jgi:hypothetical protein
MSTDVPDLRISDEERERAAAALGVHYSAGRLDQSELDERLRATYAARTQSALREVLADLPELPKGELAARAERDERRRQLQRRLLQQAGGGLTPFVVCTLIWATSGFGFFWPVFLLIGVVAPLVRHGWALYGPAPDLDRVEAALDHEAARHARAARRHARRSRRRRATG